MPEVIRRTVVVGIISQKVVPGYIREGTAEPGTEVIWPYVCYHTLEILKGY